MRSTSCSWVFLLIFVLDGSIHLQVYERSHTCLKFCLRRTYHMIERKHVQMLIFVHGIIHLYMCPWLYTVFSIYFFIYAFIYLYLSIHSLSISSFFIIYLLRFVLILHAPFWDPRSPILSQVDLDLQLPRAQLEGKGMARPSQHLVRVALVGDLCKGLTLAHHASETLHRCVVERPVR